MRVIRRPAWLALALTLLLAACGGTAAPAHSTAAASNPAASPSAPAPIDIKIAYASPSASFWGLYASKEAGYYQKYGLNVSLQQMQGTLMVPALLNGEVDVIDLAAGGLVPAVLAGADLKLIASDSNVSVYGFFATDAIQKPADLAGKTVVIAGRGQSDDYLIRRILTMNHLQPDKDVALVPSGGTPETLAVLKAGKAVGGMMSPPTLFQGLDMGLHLLLKPSDLFPYQGSGLIMRAANLATPKGADVARRVVRAHLDALHRIHDDKPFATQALMKYVNGTTEDVANRTWDWVVPGMPQDGYPTRDGLQLVIEDLKELYQGKTPPSVDGLLDLSYLDALKKA
jgi:ABC-type nitrate/sulfonate/bicarbonate transport system substrate-binding protein